MITRRSLLQAGAATLLASAAPALAQRPRELLIRNARILTMDAALGELTGSIHVRDGAIVAIGPQVTARAAQVIDADGMIALPGLVDTHCHMWGALIRSMAGDAAPNGYFALAARHGAAMTPDDMYHAVRLCAAEALNAGTTTIHDWCHNVRSREHALADLRALTESGLRARWSMGWKQGQPNDVAADLGLADELHRDWARYANARVKMGFAWRGMVRVTPMPESVYRKEFEAARGLGLPISVHAGSAATARGEIAALHAAGLLGPDVQVIHGVSATPEEIALLKQSGSTLSISPGSELRIGYGLAPVDAFVRSGIPLGVSSDTAALIGEQSLFGALKLTRLVANGASGDEFRLSARQALELGTLGGARSLGIADQVGSLAPGKRADILLLSTRALNMTPSGDLSHLVIEGTLPENVDTVIVDGQILKRHGRLTTLPAAKIIDEARMSFEALTARMRAAG